MGDEESLKRMADCMPNKIENQVPLKRIIKKNQKKKIVISKLADAAKKAVWPSLVFNLSNEFAFKFSLCVFGDKAADVTSRTSYLTRQQVINIESEHDRFEISRNIQSENSDAPCTYTLSKVLIPEQLDNEFYSLPDTQVPLEMKYKSVIFNDLDWQDFIWNDCSLKVRS